jgi:U3 small nucleolar RNA-associated protein 21
MDLKSGSMISELTFVNKSRISTILHPTACLNKILVGFDDGHLELWNIRTGKHIYGFKCLEVLSIKSSITKMVQSPACDIIGIGFASGDIAILNIRLDCVLFHFRQKGMITSISFRSDPLTSKFPYIISSSNFGHIYVWMIGNVSSESTTKTITKLESTLVFAHSNSISKLEFLPGEPVFVSSSEDNSIKVWIFDNPDGTARLLKSREGHSKYPRKMKFYGDLSSNALVQEEVYSNMQGIISADDDGRLLFTRIEKDYDFQEMSQSSIDRKDYFSKGKLSPCIDFDFAYIGSKPWGDFVSIHENQKDAFVWKVENKAATKTVLKFPQPIVSLDSKDSLHISASAVCVSVCGNFAVVGYSLLGMVGKFNIQSGLFRGFFDLNKTRRETKVNGVFIDVSNSVLVSINSSGALQFWNFGNFQLKREEKLPHALQILVGNRENNFIACADTQYVVRMYDLDTFNLCRVFMTKHTDQITSLCFSIDLHHLISSSLDGSLQVWNISSSRMTSWLHFDDSISSIVLAPNGDLITARKNHQEIILSADRSLTETVNVLSEPLAPVSVMGHYDIALTVESSSSMQVENMNLNDLIQTHKKVGGLTLSDVSKSYWSAICNAELIQKRNMLTRPQEIKQVPFFIPTQVQPPELSIVQSALAILNPVTKSKILKRRTSFR